MTVEFFKNGNANIKVNIVKFVQIVNIHGASPVVLSDYQ